MLGNVANVWCCKINLVLFIHKLMLSECRNALSVTWTSWCKNVTPSTFLHRDAQFVFSTFLHQDIGVITLSVFLHWDVQVTVSAFLYWDSIIVYTIGTFCPLPSLKETTYCKPCTFTCCLLANCPNPIISMKLKGG